MEPIVSVIIPVYNSEKYIGQCLDSVISQSLKNIEIICVDDKSIDSSVEIINKYASNDSRVNLLIQDENMHQGAARNRGLNLAKGKYVFFLDSDDWISSDGLKIMVEKAEHENSDLVLSGEYCVFDNEIKPGWRNFENKKSLEEIDDSNFFDTFTGVCMRLYKRSFIEKFNIRFPIRTYYEDNSWGLLVSLFAKNISFTKNIYYYRRHSLSTTAKNDVTVLDWVKDCQYFFDFLKNNNLETKKIYLAQIWYLKNFLDFFERLPSKIKLQFIKGIYATIPKMNICIDDIKNAKIREFEKERILNFYRVLTLKTIPIITQKVSVIIPIFNVEKYLSRCLNSVISQTYKNLEIICVNDGSTDESSKIIDSYASKDSRIIVVNKSNGGLSSARNAGLKVAKGEYCYFVDSDDWIENETIELLLYLINVTQTDCVVHGCVNVPEDSELNFISNNCQDWFDSRRTKDGVYDVPLNISSGIPAVAWNKLYITKIIKNHNCEFPNGLTNEDEAFIWFYMVHCSRYCFINDNLYNYYRRKNSIMLSNLNLSDKSLDILRAHHSIYDYINKNGLSEKYNKVLTSNYIYEYTQLFSRLNLYLKVKANDLLKLYCKINSNIRLKKLFMKYKKSLFKNKIKKFLKRIGVTRHFVESVFSIKESGFYVDISILGLKFKKKSKKLLLKVIYEEINSLNSKIDSINSKADNITLKIASNTDKVISEINKAKNDIKKYEEDSFQTLYELFNSYQHKNRS